MNWQMLLGYLAVGTALLAGGVLGYRRWHRAATVFLGPALGIGLVIVANTWISNDSTDGGGDLSWRIIVRGAGLAFVLVYLVAFAFAVAAGAIMRKQHASG